MGGRGTKLARYSVAGVGLLCCAGALFGNLPPDGRWVMLFLATLSLGYLVLTS